jgi:hypothetical protein
VHFHTSLFDSFTGETVLGGYIYSSYTPAEQLLDERDYLVARERNSVMTDNNDDGPVEGAANGVKFVLEPKEVVSTVHHRTNSLQ